MSFLPQLMAAQDVARNLVGIELKVEPKRRQKPVWWANSRTRMRPAVCPPFTRPNRCGGHVAGRFAPVALPTLRANFEPVAAARPIGYIIAQAPVAQLDRALPSEGKGHTFESCRVRQHDALGTAHIHWP
jgi:hypothetical protein